jgi:hypothetical protein
MESLKHGSAQNTEKKRQCLKAFYDEDTEPGVKVCWETVLKTVSSFPISNQKLAKKIANKYNVNTILINFEIMGRSTSHNNIIPVPDVQFAYFETHTLNYSELNQTINLKQFGYKLHFLPNTSLEPVSFTIGIAGLLPYIVSPANTTLVSALYYIKTSSELLQPVIIEIQHCVNATNGKLTFAKATVESDHTSPYVFTKLSGGKFHRKYWGTMKLSNFCFVAIFNEDENSSIDYLAHLSRLHRNGEPGVYQVALTASLNLNIHKEVNRNNCTYSINSKHNIILLYIIIMNLHNYIGCKERI